MKEFKVGKGPKGLFFAAATVIAVVLTALTAAAQMTIIRFEGEWDLSESDPRVVNVYKLAAAGQETRTFGITRIGPVGVRSRDPKAAPQFYPVTNILGSTEMLEEFFGADAGRKVVATGQVKAGGQNFVLSSVSVPPLGPPGPPPDSAGEPLPEPGNGDPVVP